jgi:WD40 repeat protein
MRPFNDSKLISATFSPNDNKVALYLIKNGMSLTPCVIYLNLSAPFTHLNAMIIFEGDRGFKAFENFYLNGLSPAIFSPNGQFIAFSAIQSPKGIDFDHNVIKFYEVQQGQIKTIDVNGKSELGRVLTIAFTPDSQIIASAGTEERIRFWNVLTREEILQTFDSSVKGRVQAISFSPNGKFLVSGSSRGVIRLWNWQEKRLLISLKANDNVSFVESLAFSPDSQKLVVGESSGAIKIYDINDQGIYQAYDILASKWGGICSINFSSHREIFASGSSDGEVKIWDTEKGELLHTLCNESKIGVRSVAFNSNGDALIAAMEKDKVYIWHRQRGE